MSFNLRDLRATGQSKVFSEIRKSQGPHVTAKSLVNEHNTRQLFESANVKTDAFDIFLSHSFLDAEAILGVIEKLKGFGYTVYVDWIDDAQLDRNNITKATVDTVKLRMLQSKCLLYATSLNATQSKWMPWELGYMDGKKDRTAILPLFESDLHSSYDYKGQEYLGAYPYCIQANYKINPQKEGLWIFADKDNNILFSDWLAGKKP